MPVNLIKLCVGAESVDDLEQWIARRLGDRRRRGEPEEHFHVTRMMPRRVAELLDGGSLYWVIRGVIQCRQRLVDVRRVIDQEGTARCALVLEPSPVLVEPRPRDPFQGWRYLTVDDAPPDLAGRRGSDEMPVEMRRELAALGLL
jgi:hypothetical protein